MNGDYILLNDGSILNLSLVMRVHKRKSSRMNDGGQYYLICYERPDGSNIEEYFQKAEERNEKFNSIIKTFALTLRK